MVTTPLRPRPPRADRPDRAERAASLSLRFHAGRAPRRPLLAIGSLVLVVVSAAGFASLYAHAGGRVAVVAVARGVPAGTTIEARDLTIVQVTLTPSLHAVGARSLPRIIGQQALYPLFAGTLLVPSEVVREPGPAPGDAVVGVATKPGQLPAMGVKPGQTVAVIMTTQPGETITGLGSSQSSTSGLNVGATAAGAVLAPQAMVLDVLSQPASSTGASDGTIIVSVVVPASLAPAIASASAAGQVALVLVDSGS